MRKKEGGAKRTRMTASHYLYGCRFDNLIRLLWRSAFRVAPDRIAQVAAVLLVSLLLWPFALLEAVLFALPIRRARPKLAPVFIVGHWRSGTTYLQNIMSRDPQFGWADPVSTVMLPYRFLLGWLLAPMLAGGLKAARPMDNMVYGLDLPLEEAFAVATISPYAVSHCCAFPNRFSAYLTAVFPSALSPRARREWRRNYSYVIDKLSLAHGGRRLILKSPDNTGHLDELVRMYPDARFVNIHRDPYRTISSAIHMFQKQMELLRVTELPPGDIDSIVRENVLAMFGRMYDQLFQFEKKMPANRFINVRYEALIAAPETVLRGVYDALELDGFEEALPFMRAHVASQAGYVKNSYPKDEALRGEINRALKRYFDRYGYPMDPVPAWENPSGQNEPPREKARGRRRFRPGTPVRTPV